MSALEVVKKGKNYVLYKDKGGQRFLRIDNIRFSYCYVGTPSDDKDEDGNSRKRWRTDAWLNKSTHAEAKEIIDKVIQAVLNEAPKTKGVAPKVAADKRFIKDGDESEDEKAHGNWIVSSADPKVRPRARNERGEIMDDIQEIDEKFYAGSYGSVLIRPWFFGGQAKGSTKTFPKRVSAGLSGVMFARNGEPLGAGRVDDTDAWDGVETDADNDGMGSEEDNDY